MQLTWTNCERWVLMLICCVSGVLKNLGVALGTVTATWMTLHGAGGREHR